MINGIQNLKLWLISSVSEIDKRIILVEIWHLENNDSIEVHIWFFCDKISNISVSVVSMCVPSVSGRGNDTYFLHIWEETSWHQVYLHLHHFHYLTWSWCHPSSVAPCICTATWWGRATGSTPASAPGLSALSEIMNRYHIFCKTYSGKILSVKLHY